VERFAKRTGLFCVFVGLLSTFAARRLPAPIAEFGRASERLGVDRASPPLTECRPRELRAATHAFNRMQERLRRFIADRTQMLAAMSHDLRTPLARLRLRAEFIAGLQQRRKMLADLDEMESMVDATLQANGKLTERRLMGQAPSTPDTAAVGALSPRLSLSEIESLAIAEAMKTSRGNVSQAARLLGLTRAQLRHRLNPYSKKC
jgi:signal transduction histidine kinase